MPIAIVIPADDSAPVKTQEMNGLNDYQSVVGGWIESVATPSGDFSMYVNEEGKMMGLPLNRRATEMVASMLFQGDFIAGDAVIVGFDPATGEDTDIPECFQP